MIACTEPRWCSACSCWRWPPAARKRPAPTAAPAARARTPRQSLAAAAQRLAPERLAWPERLATGEQAAPLRRASRGRGLRGRASREQGAAGSAGGGASGAAGGAGAGAARGWSGGGRRRDGRRGRAPNARRRGLHARERLLRVPGRTERQAGRQLPGHLHGRCLPGERDSAGRGGMRAWSLRARAEMRHGSRVTCLADPAACPAGTVHSVLDSCWGPCLLPTECTHVNDCGACGEGSVCVRNNDWSRVGTACVTPAPDCRAGNYCGCLAVCPVACRQTDAGVLCFCGGC